MIPQFDHLLNECSVWSLCWWMAQFDPCVEWMLSSILVFNECSVWSLCWMISQFDPCVKWMLAQFDPCVKRMLAQFDPCVNAQFDHVLNECSLLSSILGYRLNLCWMNAQYDPWLNLYWRMLFWLLYLMSSNDESDYSTSCWRTLMGLTPVLDVKKLRIWLLYLMLKNAGYDSCTWCRWMMWWIWLF